MDFHLQPVEFAQLPGWYDDDPSAVIAALDRCHGHVTRNKPYRTGALGVSTSDMLPAMTDASAFAPASVRGARRFFEDRFVPFEIVRADRAPGFVTAFYEPEVRVRETPDAVHIYPFYSRPPDLVDIDDTNRPEDLDPYFAFGRLDDGRVDEYPDRQMIEQGWLNGKGLEIAFAASRLDVYFAHIQGAARLIYPDGSMRRITYAAKSGHRFSPIGKLLIEQGAIDAATVSMQSIRQWLEVHPEEMDAVLWHNRSFIFFKESAVDDPALGPIAAAKVALEPGRSLAVDRLVHTFGMPFFIVSDSLTHIDGDRPFRRLMLALDTGSAIVGPARGDIFTGSGDAAGLLAGAVRNAATFYIFVPKAAAARYDPRYRHG